MIEFQNFNTHSFSPALAKAFGLKDAIWLQHIYYWLKHNKGKGKNCQDGNWWTYNTRKGFSEYFEYLTEDDIRGIVDRLKKKEILLVGNYNKSPYDKTAWYSLTEKGWKLFNDAIGEIPQSNGDSPQSHGEKAKSMGERNDSNGYNTDSKSYNSPTYTNSKTSIKHFFSLPLEEKREILKKIWTNKKLKSDSEKYLLFRESKNWKSVPNLEADIAWWENGHKDKYPELHVEKLSSDLSFVPAEEETGEIKEIRSQIKFYLGKANKPDACVYFAGKEIQKTNSGSTIFVTDEKAMEYQEILAEINVTIEVKK